MWGTVHRKDHSNEWGKIQGTLDEKYLSKGASEQLQEATNNKGCEGTIEGTIGGKCVEPRKILTIRTRIFVEQEDEGNHQYTKDFKIL